MGQKGLRHPADENIKLQILEGLDKDSFDDVIGMSHTCYVHFLGSSRKLALNKNYDFRAEFRKSGCILKAAVSIIRHENQ